MDVALTSNQLIEGFGPAAGLVIAGLLFALGVIIREWRRREEMHEARVVELQKLYLKLFTTMIDSHNETNKLLETLEQKMTDDVMIREALAKFITRRLEGDE